MQAKRFHQPAMISNQCDGATVSKV